MTEVGYASDKPSDCAYCYFFSAGRKKCKRKEMFLSYFFSATSQEGNSLGGHVKAVLMENILPVWVTAL